MIVDLPEGPITQLGKVMWAVGFFFSCGRVTLIGMSTTARRMKIKDRVVTNINSVLPVGLIIWVFTISTKPRFMLRNYVEYPDTTILILYSGPSSPS
ncbi:uncharacterized protein F4822DRAFT_404894 [Hypoxylon trugodes]|uniref:uncharacterized protein n=1 Tax=Hypoxylon trugodes TaxID=326681 RepID=UPI0021967CA3|nr:uncharacterized protein F4822DRAFT_404894 [Hypoxylon trugodes]KAI1389081.1 hypothetical protein F4822DRAFT_404894 [Hypoxylon trugodes]